MAELTLHCDNVATVMVDTFLNRGLHEGGPFVVVKLVEEKTRIFVGDDPASIRRARAIASALTAACDVLDGHKVVPISSLAPDLPPAA